MKIIAVCGIDAITYTNSVVFSELRNCVVEYLVVRIVVPTMRRTIRGEYPRRVLRWI